MATSDFGIPAMRSYQILLVGKYSRISVAEISSIDETSCSCFCPVLTSRLMQCIPVLAYHDTRSERQKLETRKYPVWLDGKVPIWSLYPPGWCRLLDHVRELLASSVTPQVLHQAIAEYQVVLAEASIACVCADDFHPRLIRTFGVTEIHDRNAGGPQAQDTPRNGGPT